MGNIAEISQVTKTTGTGEGEPYARICHAKLLAECVKILFQLRVHADSHRFKKTI